MAEPFRSSRLVYRAVEPETDEAFFLQIQQDPVAWINSNAALAKPQGKKDAKSYIKIVEESLLGVVIRLPASPSTSNPGPTNTDPIPIGTIFLKSPSASMLHHRTTEIGIDILKPYQGQGYGSEAIRWVLNWAFENAGMHRVEIGCLGWNEGARRLYERLGFRLEGTKREALWWRGRWWDDWHLGILEGEWRERQRETGWAK